MAGGHRGLRKIGRNEKTCARYRQERRREKNKLRKVKHHFNKHPRDTQALKFIEKYDKELPQM